MASHHAFAARDPLALTRDDAETAFRFFPAAPPLDRFVEYFYYSVVPRSLMSAVDAMRLPEVEAQLVFALEQGSSLPGGQWLASGVRACLFVQPAHLEVIPIPTGIRHAVGAALKPAGLRLLLPKGAGNMIDAPLVALEDLWGAEAHALLERLVVEATPAARVAALQQCLREKVRDLAAPSRLVTHAFELVRAAHGEISTEQLARACGCTSRTLRSATVLEAGLSPKHLARIVRIRHALDLLASAGVPLSDAAVASAFSDHAHMSREFRELIGAPPSEVRSRLSSTALPSFPTERNLMSTGLLVMPKTSRSIA